MRQIILFAGIAAAIAGPALADPIPNSGDVGRAFAMEGGGFDQSFNPVTRDANGNRVIIDGRMELEGTLSGGLMDSSPSGFGSAQALGNQLNVITQGNWNTVIVDSTQINNGDVSAVVNGGH